VRIDGHCCARAAHARPRTVAASASRAATNVHHFALELGITLKVLLVAPRIVLVVVIVTLFGITLNDLALVFCKRT